MSELTEISIQYDLYGNEEKAEKVERIFDTLGNIISETKYTRSRSAFELETKETNKYKKDTLLERYLEYADKDYVREVYSFSKDNKITQTAYYSFGTPNTVSYQAWNVYDKNKKITEYHIIRDGVEQTTVYPSSSTDFRSEGNTYQNGVLKNRSLYLYDISGKITESYYYTNGGTFLYSKTLYSYSPNSEEVIDENYSVAPHKEHYKYIFEYDINENWTSRFKYDLKNNGRLEQRCTRVYKYFDK